MGKGIRGGGRGVPAIRERAPLRYVSAGPRGTARENAFARAAPSGARMRGAASSWYINAASDGGTRARGGMSAPNGSGGSPPPFASSTLSGGSARAAAIKKMKNELKRLEASLRTQLEDPPRNVNATMWEMYSTKIEVILLNINGVRACLLQQGEYDI